MEFTEKEQKIIKDARKALKSFKMIAYLIFSVWLILLFATLIGYLDFNTLIYPSILFIAIFLLFPGIGHGPKYADLVNLLESKVPEKETLDKFIEAIKEVKKT